MFESKGFIQKLSQLLKMYNLSATSFSRMIGVQRSVTSHVLSGRNKPSLDFIIKILSAFPDVDFEWLILDKGEAPSAKSQEVFPPTDSHKQGSLEFDELTEKSTPSDMQKTVEKVIILYSDKSFDTYQ